MEEQKITIQFYETRVRKTFSQNMGLKNAHELFQREVAVLRYLSDLKANCVPRLVDLDERALWHETERIEGVQPLDVWLMSAPSNGLDTVISQLIAIDKLLYLNRINYRESSPQHILVSKNFDTFITGFEFTHLGQRLKDILFKSLFQNSQLSGVQSGMGGVFMSSLIARRDEVYNYHSRKLRSTILHRFGLSLS